MKQNKKKQIKTDWLLKVLTFLFFASLGFFSVYYELKYFGEITLTYYLYTIIVILVSIPFHVFLHEVGHLIAGYLSGYDFIMFRLFNRLWIKTDQGLSKRKQTIPGVLGQALMVPPEGSQKESPPFLFYHLGGLIFNGLTAFLLILFGRGTADPFTRYFFYLSAVTAIFMLITNLLPFKGTDGYNIVRYLKKKQPDEEIVTLLYLYRDLVHGVSFKDLQKNIDINEFQDFKNPNTATFHSIHAAAYLEAYDFENARKIYASLWQNIDQLFEGHQADIGMNYFFTLLLTDPTHSDVKKIQKSNLYKAYGKIKQADSYRAFAAEALYLEQDYKKAFNLLEKGEKEIPFSPTVSDERLENLLYGYLNQAIAAQK